MRIRILSRLGIFLILILLVLQAAASVSAAPRKTKIRWTPPPTPAPTASPTPAPTPGLTPTPSPTPTLAPTPAPTPTPTPAAGGKEMLGYTTYYYSGDVSSLNSMKNNAGSIDAIAAAVHLTDSTGGITGPVPTEQIAFAASAGIRAYALVGNNFSGSIAKILLESSIYRQRMILNLLSLLRNNGYKGVCMDFEGMYATNRDQYSSFLREISASIKPLGYDLIVCVAAKTYDNPSNSWSGAFDYPAIGQVADRVAVMTYDEHYMGGVPGPVASIGWVTRVADYTVSVIPPEKVLLGVAAYGYDWGSGGCKAYSMNGCLNLASQYGAVIQWDAVSQSPWFRYTDAAGAGHEVWFESAQSIRFKLDLVNVRNICGIALWRLGLENAAFWSTLGDLY